MAKECAFAAASVTAKNPLAEENRFLAVFSGIDSH
jgi:hypothetical protein